MANLQAKVVVRVTSEDGKRSWVNANGKHDPKGSFYVQWCEGSKPKYKFVGPSYDEALVAKIRKERELKIRAGGGPAPAPVIEEPKNHRIEAVITAYLADLKLSRFSEKSIKAKRFELETFAKFCGKVYVEQIYRVDLLKYKNHLLDVAHMSERTTYNKLMHIVTWLKKNTVVEIVKLLKTDDWPKEVDTVPEPYSQVEEEAMMAVATPNEKLLLRFFLATGCREQEVAHAEYEDLEKNYIRIRPKPQYQWRPKTDAGTRTIVLGATLMQDLRNHGVKGLIFPSPQGQPEGHFLRIVKNIAKRAGVANAKLHRFRDSYATTQVRARKLDLRDIARSLGHRNLDTINLYAEFLKSESPEAQAAADESDKYGTKIHLVERAMAKAG